MTILYDFDARPLLLGTSRDFTLTSRAPAEVQIKCFITTPPPPGYRPCAECGSYSIQQGQTIQIEASRYLFSNAQGGLYITITDLDGDVVEIQLRVVNDEPGSASAAVKMSM